MKKLTILIPAGHNNLSSVIGAYQFFLKANDFCKTREKKPVFDIQLAGVSKKVELHDGLFSIRPHVLIREVTHSDLVIIPATAHFNISKMIELNKEIIDWLKKRYRQGTELASICTGGFLLAATGLLKGKNCSTHWNTADMFRKMFPDVHVQTGAIITDEQGIYTNGGAFSFLNLMLYLIEKNYDRETALYCAKTFQVDIDRVSQSPFTIFSAQKEHSDEAISKAQAYIEDNLTGKFSMEDLATRYALSRRNFDRRFIKATGNTPAEYLQRVRIERAKKMLESGPSNVSEVMYEVGYADIKAFRGVFRKITGLTPLDYRNKYNKNITIFDQEIGDEYS
ncbi:helix-turn-helix domain-containing protein [Pseudoflavitalea sp. G-6-1-2]|uniref:GlxA family transcriptional regulator n=1 Tax=Pseudoflavitalea sp. G-6-1-2 TaxID=2728841 RepID=UPI00146CE9F1|nr:helix-turn-helix domain-containing protein [Pseudoflavitalea sp. G-6-1-2]NML21564.1 helix-turn-helix domain-containing protein [Pseudoflavitalea sp. G-6-1-2]